MTQNFAFIFDAPIDSDADGSFESNDCFNTSGDLTMWLTKATSGQYYKRWVRPGVNESEKISPPTQVNVSIDMNSMASVDELNSEYKIILKIDLEWMDERLKYNCSTKPVTTTLSPYLLERIWSPKLGVPNIKDPESTMIEGEATLILGQIRTDGYIHIRQRLACFSASTGNLHLFSFVCLPSLLLNLFCYLHFELFPFDSQQCFIKLESRTYQQHDLVLRWRNDHPFRNLESFQMSGMCLFVCLVSSVLYYRLYLPERQAFS